MLSTTTMTPMEYHKRLQDLERMCEAAAERWYEADGKHRVVWCVGEYIDKPEERLSISHLYRHVLYILLDGYTPDNPKKRFSYFRSVHRTKNSRRHNVRS